MPAAQVPMVIDQGEDFTAQIIWTDNQGNPMRVSDPIRMDVVDRTMPVLSLTTPDEDLDDIPEISYSTEIGLIQIHIPKEQTSAIAPGTYDYDLFAAVDDGDAYAGNQIQRILVGKFYVNKRITVM